MWHLPESDALLSSDASALRLQGAPIDFETDLFTGRVAMWVKGLPTAAPDLFQGKRRRTRITVQGRFKRPLPFQDVRVAANALAGLQSGLSYAAESAAHTSAQSAPSLTWLHVAPPHPAVSTSYANHSLPAPTTLSQTERPVCSCNPTTSWRAG